MPDFDSFDTDFDGDVDRIDFLGFDYLIRHVLEPDEGGPEGDEWSASPTDDEVHDDWDDDDEADDGMKSGR